MRAVIYARYSSDNQREESIDGQLRECKKFAEYNGITVVGEYITFKKSQAFCDFLKVICLVNSKIT